MSIVTRLTRIKTRAEATRLVIVYTLLGAALASGASAVEAMFMGTPVVDEAIGGLVIAGVITPLLTGPLARAALELSQREARLEVQANTDSMTGALNRRGFFAAARPLFERPDAPLSALLVDLDRFKQINDAFGHAAGDEVVIAAAAAIAAVAAPQGAVVGRVGGDEFCVLAPGLTEEAAQGFAERLRDEIRSRALRRGDLTIRMTASVGVAARRGDDAQIDDLLARADAALYEAKSNGRNQAVAGASPVLRAVTRLSA